MKKTLLALALAASTTTQAGTYGFTYSAENNVAWVNGDGGSYFKVFAHPNNGCKVGYNIGRYLGFTPASTSPVYTVMTMRVDRNPVKTAPVEARYESGSTWETTIIQYNVALNAEMRRGTTLRIKVHTVSGVNYEAFSMMGYSTSFAKVKANCKSHEKWFDVKPAANKDHSTYL